MQDVTKISEKLGLNDFIQSYKNGYDAVLDPLGKRLSANIKQEILLVRALLGNRSLLLLENPFNNLDDKEKATLITYLRNEHSATIFITSEDPKIQDQCDVVLKLENGFLI